ncbi:MAG: hypothetical protein KDD56_04295, partial [Bdellovibrionales bacterium]|nr:hypothetical protein [Bdellovibrionales bacterium]
AALDRQLINLEFLLQESQTQKLPYNYAKRELELTSQLSELANAAKRVESLEADNQNLEGIGVEEMLELIERAKAYDAEVLAARIRGLEKRISA